MSRQEIKNAESAYAFLCTEVFEGDASKLSIEDLIDCFCARYSHDFLRLPYLDEFDFYDCVLKNANEIIGKKSDGEQKQLAVLLIKKITNYFDIFNLKAVKFFIAAVIVACFNSLKESDQYFRDAFCDFDSDNSNPEAFCRLMIVAAIEDYCRNKCKDIRPWHRSVISFDGDVIKNTICRTEYFSFVKIIWYKWSNPQKLSQHFAILDSFFELDSLPRISIYRTIRMQSVIT